MSKNTPVVDDSRLLTLYNTTMQKELLAELGLQNIHEVPKLNKIVLNVGLGKTKEEKRSFDVANTTLRKITGQQPVVTASRHSIAAFKLREGQKVGMRVTLRGRKMYDFLDRFVTLVLPRVRDFHGVSVKSFDKSGNYSFGLKDQSVFPELNFEDTTYLHGLQINFVINSKDPQHSKALLEKMGMPFEKKESK